MQETKVEAERELEALEQALKADKDLLSQQQARDLILAAEALKARLKTNELEAIENAVQQLKTHSDAFAALRMNRHIDHALKGTKLEDWSNSN